jgi:signal transduction histidine kinase
MQLNRLRLAMLITFFIGLLLSAALFAYVASSDAQKTREHFVFNVHERLDALRTHLLQHEDILNATTAFIRNSETVRRGEFDDFAASVISHNPTIHALSWNPFIPNSERQRYIDAARNDGFETFNIKSLSPDRGLIVDPDKPSYVAVYYISPLEGNEKALGVDISSNRKRKAAIDEARDTGNIVMTERIKLVQKSGSGDAYGHLIMRAVYKKGSALKSVDDRRKAFQGVAVAVIHLNNLVNAVFDHTVNNEMHALIFDATDHHAKEALYHFMPDLKADTEAYEAVYEKATAELHLIENVEVFNQTWQLLFTPTHYFFKYNQHYNAWFFLAIGLLVTLSLCSYLYLLSLRTDRLIKRYLASSDYAGSLENQVAIRTRELEIASRAKSDFLANVSHELRTPLNGILGFTNMLLKKESDPSKQQKLTVIKESSDRLLKVIDDIFDFSNLDNHTLDINYAPVDFRGLIDQCLDQLQMHAQSRGITIETSIDARLPDTITGDGQRLRQLLGNLLDNAVKFSHEGGEVTLSVTCNPEHDELRCSITDHGIGIAVEKLQSIFKPFEQADNSATREHGGTGLGLSISKLLVEAMGGSISIQSTLGEGSTFTFTLPHIANESAQSGV